MGTAKTARTMQPTREPDPPVLTKCQEGIAQRFSGDARGVLTTVTDPETGAMQCAHAVYALQRAAGNGRVGRMLGAPVQAKLTVNAPGDAYEQEADRVAEQVMRMEEPGPGSQSPVTIQRQALSGTTPEVTPEAESHINATRGGGQPLPDPTRAFAEPRFGQDFGGVRVHVDAQSNQVARALSAQAFTTGQDIYFGAGHYQPGTAQGDRLLAHELTHVAQQSQSEQPLQRDPLGAGGGAGGNASVYDPNVPTSTLNDPEALADQQRAVQLQDLQTRLDSQTARFSTTREQLRALPSASSAERTALESDLDEARLELLSLLEARASLLSTEIQRLRVRIGPHPQSSPDRPGLDQLGNELNQRERELQKHRQQMAPLRAWQTQRQVEATQQQIEAINQEILNLPPLDPEHPTSDMNDPRAQELMQQREALEQQKQAQAESAGEQWAQIDLNTRMAYVMDLLVTKYRYPVNGAAGLVGNLSAESGVLPQRLEGSKATTPMKTSGFRGRAREFTPQEVLNRSFGKKSGPRLPGVGLAQWTTGSRRRGLFQHQFGGRQMGTDILFNMDAQVDYLVNELQANYPRVNRVLTNPKTSVNDACDEVLYNFEVPGSLLDANKHKRPRTDPQVVRVFNQRRPLAQRTLTSFKNMK